MPKNLSDIFKGEGTPIRVKRGEVIIRAQEEPGGVYLINEGFIKTYSITKYGETNLRLIRKKNDIFPLIWVLTDLHREVFYESMTDAELFKISREKFNDFIKKSSAQMELVDRTVELYRIHADRVANLQLRTAKERLAFRLLALYDRFGREVDGAKIIDAPLRHQDIADSINTVRETTSREIEKLEAAGVIGMSKDHKISLINTDKLRKLIS